MLTYGGFTFRKSGSFIFIGAAEILSLKMISGVAFGVKIRSILRINGRKAIVNTSDL